MKNPLFVSVPHSGEIVPEKAYWLKGLPEPTLMRDVDRYVHELYQPALNDLALPNIIAETHRYVVDLNRVPEDIDASSVVGAANPAGSHPTGFHWVVTTIGEELIKEPITQDLHQELTDLYWRPFHERVKKMYADFGVSKESRVFQLDAHSMPSKGTDKHRDPGETRAEVVISDQEGKSCGADFKELVVDAYRSAGFQVKLNWPYLGGRVTQTYGKPDTGQNCIQVELNRAMYMDEDSKKRLGTEFTQVSDRIAQALGKIVAGMSSL